MAESTEKTLFFIKSPTVNSTAIESFLKKRGFIVVSETDIRVAILEIMKTAPDYILISLDHPSERITHLPKLISQSVITTIIAYCSSNDKLQVRKLQASAQPLKLFPPLSGPAIQRLISRLEKEKEASIPSADTVIKKNDSQKNAQVSNQALIMKILITLSKIFQKTQISLLKDLLKSISTKEKEPQI
jgi:DNA-binding response OmpR family regulator